ncbi:hypothetical protein M3Y94_00006100 [Aphelenchoides besseyi]|nr:hypothetical protein M3Y94_00006100 [Aphelenchoides besseyi]KAI6220760.1 HMG box domain-containing protein [Aphelenchoides besseyi]
MPKQEKDPNAPKRPMSSFFIWMKENRERLKKPGMSAAEVAMIGGDEWGKLVDKSEWMEKAEIEQQRYERELVAYIANK